MSSIEEYKLFLELECKRKIKEIIIKIKMFKLRDPARNDIFKRGIIHDLNIIDAELTHFMVEIEGDKKHQFKNQEIIKQLREDLDFLRETIAKISKINLQENFEDAKKKIARLVLDVVLRLKEQEKMLR